MIKSILLAALLSLGAYLFWPGRLSSLFYYPDRASYGTPRDVGLPFEEVAFASGDGTRLFGWFVPAVGKPRGTVIHFHGNAQNMSAHFSFVSWLPAAGFNLFLFDYRGYGGSEGKPERKGIYEDCVAALSYLTSRKDIDRDGIFVLGQSLGGANALAAVGGNSFKGIRAVAIESAFASYRGIVREKMKEIPLLSLVRIPLSYLLLGDSYSPETVVHRVSPVPLLLIYSTDDPVVPQSQGERLYEKARQPKELWIIPRGGHLAAFADSQSPYRKKLIDFYLGAPAVTSFSPATR